ncbi:unnamed protein product [Ectocarpus fasciculatus]
MRYHQWAPSSCSSGLGDLPASELCQTPPTNIGLPGRVAGTNEGLPQSSCTVHPCPFLNQHIHATFYPFVRHTRLLKFTCFYPTSKLGGTTTVWEENRRETNRKVLIHSLCSDPIHTPCSFRTFTYTRVYGGNSSSATTESFLLFRSTLKSKTK